jgi:deoxyribodipyrimidine photo-lyase
MAKDQTVNIFWFRRDLRLEDNAGLYEALKSGKPVIPVFIFDREILDLLDDKSDRRVEFIVSVIEEMQLQLTALGTSLELYYDKAVNAWEKITRNFSIDTVFTNHDYEPYAQERDAQVKTLLEKKAISFKTLKTR